MYGLLGGKWFTWRSKGRVFVQILESSVMVLEIKPLEICLDSSVHSIGMQIAEHSYSNYDCRMS